MSRKKKRDFDPKKSWGHKTKPVKSSAAERLEFCRELWTEDPHIPINGNKGMNQRLLEKFGHAARAEQLTTVRSEVLNTRRSNAFNPVFESNPLHYDRKVVQGQNLGKAKPLPEPPPVPPPPGITKPPTFPEPLLKEQGRPPLPPQARASKEEPEVKKKPEGDESPIGSTNSTVDVNMRYDYARSYYQRHRTATNEEVNNAVKAKFGAGVSAGSLLAIKKEEGVGRVHNRKKRTVTERRSNKNHRPQLSKLKEASVPTEPNQQEISTPRNIEKGVMYTKETAKGPIKAAIQMLLDEVPNLKSLDLQLDEDGKAIVADFEVYSRAYETGSIEL